MAVGIHKAVNFTDLIFWEELGANAVDPQTPGHAHCAGFIISGEQFDMHPLPFEGIYGGRAIRPYFVGQRNNALGLVGLANENRRLSFLFDSVEG
jgi:hypothetical protein